MHVRTGLSMMHPRAVGTISGIEDIRGAMYMSLKDMVYTHPTAQLPELGGPCWQQSLNPKNLNEGCLTLNMNPQTMRDSHLGLGIIRSSHWGCRNCGLVRAGLSVRA